MKILNYSEYFKWRNLKNGNIYNFKKFCSQQCKPGSSLELKFLVKWQPFAIACELKHEFFKWFEPLLDFDYFQGTCIAWFNSKFATSVLLREIEDGVTVDRRFFIYAPTLMDIKQFTEKHRFYSYNFKNYKSKLFFAKASSQRRFLAKLYY